MGERTRRRRCNSLSTLRYATHVANWGSENWKAFGKKTEPVTKSDVFKISPRPHCCKKRLQRFCLGHQNVLNFFSVFWASFQSGRGREESGRESRGTGAGSRSLTKDHFNRAY